MRPRILVVDDNASIRKFMQRFFAATFAVDVADDGTAALEKIALGERYDVLLVDLAMPALDGRALYELLCQDFSDLARRVVFVTGGPLTSEDQRFLESVANPVVHKPFSNDDLRRIVHGVAGITT